MSIAETKLSIVSQLNQKAVAALVDELANLSVEHEELKKKHADLEVRLTEIVKSRDGPLTV